jgi:hypothetical protein
VTGGGGAPGSSDGVVTSADTPSAELYVAFETMGTPKTAVRVPFVDAAWNALKIAAMPEPGASAGGLGGGSGVWAPGVDALVK